MKRVGLCTRATSASYPLQALAHNLYISEVLSVIVTRITIERANKTAPTGINWQILTRKKMRMEITATPHMLPGIRPGIPPYQKQCPNYIQTGNQRMNPIHYRWR